MRTAGGEGSMDEPRAPLNRKAVGALANRD